MKTKIDRDKAINRILSLIDESNDNWRKTGFYSDPVVQDIMMKLYERWNNNNRKGIPLDYATNEELFILVRKAEHYSMIPASEIQRQLFLEFRKNVSGGKRGFIDKIKEILGLK